MRARYGTIWICLLLLAGPAFAQNTYYDHGSFPAPGSPATSAAMRAELDLIEAGFAKLPTLSISNANKAVVVNGSGTALTATFGPIRTGTVLPLSPTVNDLFILTNSNVAGDCTPGSGSELSLCLWNGTSWEPLGSSTGAVSGWPTVLSTAAATSESAGQSISIRGQGGQATNGADFYQSSTGKFEFVCVVANVRNDCDYIRKIASGKYWGITDSSDNPVFRITPSAGTPKAKYTFHPGHYLLKSVWIGAGNLYGDGTNCPERPTAVTINSGPKIPTFICADNNGSRLTGMVRMPNDWDGGTITLTHSYIQTAADTSQLNGDAAAQCRGHGEAVSSTWGAEVAIDDSNVTGSNANDLTTSGAITPAGTCAAGDMLYFYYELDAAGTTTPTATLHHLGFHLTYSSTSLSH